MAGVAPAFRVALPGRGAGASLAAADRPPADRHRQEGDGSPRPQSPGTGKFFSKGENRGGEGGEEGRRGPPGPAPGGRPRDPPAVRRVAAAPRRRAEPV